jgi:hypothetical protein
MDPLAASPFGLLDARGSLRLATDAVDEDDALCLALACRPLRDAVRTPSPRRTTKGSARDEVVSTSQDDQTHLPAYMRGVYTAAERRRRSPTAPRLA